MTEKKPQTLEEKLSCIQTSLVAPKGQFNSFGKYKYRSCEDILEAVKPLLKQHGVVLTLSDEIVQIGDRYYVKASARVRADVSQHIIETVAYARESETKKGMDESQITGAASSYARKYALNGLFVIDDTKDADTTHPEVNGLIENTKQVKSLEEIMCLAKILFKDKKSFEDWLHARFQECDPKKLSETKANMALSLLFDMKASKE